MNKPLKIIGILMTAVLMVVAGVLLIQLIPYGHNHNNPPVTQEPNWNNQSTRALARRACMDCHSNETIWPWTSNIAPLSWLIQLDVDRGRRRLNFSTWQASSNTSNTANRIAENISNGEMPPFQYIIIHPEAILSAQEKQQLIDGILATIK